MDKNELIAIIKKKLIDKIDIENIDIQDKSFLHKNHSGYQKDKFHLKLIIISKQLKNINKVESNKIIYKILDEELKKYIHSIQILIT